MDREQMIAELEIHGWQPLSFLASAMPQQEAVMYHPDYGLLIRGTGPIHAIPGLMSRREPREWSAVLNLPENYRIAMGLKYGRAT